MLVDHLPGVPVPLVTSRTPTSKGDNLQLRSFRKRLAHGLLPVFDLWRHWPHFHHTGHAHRQHRPPSFQLTNGNLLTYNSYALQPGSPLLSTQAANGPIPLGLRKLFSVPGSQNGLTQPPTSARPPPHHGILLPVSRRHHREAPRAWASITSNKVMSLLQEF